MAFVLKVLKILFAFNPRIHASIDGSLSAHTNVITLSISLLYEEKRIEGEHAA
jgi:hypothetical protein